ncbi:uncharacterized protein PRCAT00006111001 [Priceomyces carsonii]|uniref:uncharacterized protein n=1 Tax=Priceomyces carsonii TaxID=28549 RepID=UPI002EDB29B5|nr:unnamed protein product [Priceomyces carsonii]
MTSIELSSIPESLKLDKSVTPYITRSLELQELNPVVSYYCKIYVLEHILANKLHTKSKENEQFAVLLLDNTEKIHSNEDDEGLHKVLKDKNLSTGIVMSFSYKLFNSCLEELGNFKRTRKLELVQKIRATINFLSLLGIFANEESGVDFKKLTGDKAETPNQFDDLNKNKIKILKFQLSKLIKDEIPEKNDDEELEKELNQELENLTPSSSPGEDLEDDLEEDSKEHLDTPEEKDHQRREASSEAGVKLPQAPHFLPEDDDEEVKLPGAPKFLPDDDPTKINKTSSIHVFTPETDHESEHLPNGAPEPTPAPEKGKRALSHAPMSHSSAPPINKENVNSMMEKGDQIAKVQKHAKFAISALNYEDLETAETELLQGLELLKLIKEN